MFWAFNPEYLKWTIWCQLWIQMSEDNRTIIIASRIHYHFWWMTYKMQILIVLRMVYPFKQDIQLCKWPRETFRPIWMMATLRHLDIFLIVSLKLNPIIAIHIILKDQTSILQIRVPKTTETMEWFGQRAPVCLLKVSNTCTTELATPATLYSQTICPWTTF